MDAPQSPRGCILTVNPGSSSLKVALHDNARELARRAHADVARIGEPEGRLRAAGETGEVVHETTAPFADHDAALAAVLDWLHDNRLDLHLIAAGVRVVYGGPRNREPKLVTPALVAELEQTIPLDPDHTPQALATLRALGRHYPSLPQIACFDTAFHRTLARVAQMYPLPRRFFEQGVMRYGFHGLSCEYIVEELRAIDSARAGGRVIVAHLGNGASMTAVRDGRSVDTTMGFTPAGGLMMGTRTGDLDPGVILHLQRAEGMSPADVNELVNRQSGLAGVSGVTSDMRELLAREARDAHAADAVALFCHLARKFLAGLAAALGGLDTLVFTGGIGENAAPVRARICAGLEFMGIQIDEGRNQRQADLISSEMSPVVVRVMKTNEDLMIARHVRDMLRRDQMQGVTDGRDERAITHKPTS